MDILLLIILAIAAYFTGTYSEKRHYASIRKREASAPKIPVISTEDIPPELIVSTRLVMGNTVVGVDYFRHILAGIINFFGGRITIFESVLDRGRREALLRLRETAGTHADYIGCVRYETSILNGETRGLPQVEVLVYGTAYYLKDQHEIQAHGF